MKKMLLLLVCLTTFAWLHAETATFTCADKYGTSTISAEGTWQLNDVLSFTFAKGGGSSAPAYNKAKDVRLYAKNTATLKALDGYTIESVVFILSSQGKQQYATITSSDGAMGTQAKGDVQCSWTGDVSSVTFTVGASNDYGTSTSKSAGQLCFTSVTVTYSKAGPATQVATPSFSVEGAVEVGTKVEIDCKTADAKIYYTTDETDPTETSTLYDASTGIIVNEAMTVKAIAVKEGLEKSEIATATYTPFVAMPTFSVPAGAVEVGTKISLFCTTSGATIEYSLNGGEMVEYTEPIEINEETKIEAWATKGSIISEIAEATYTIVGELKGEQTVTLVFSEEYSEKTILNGKTIDVNEYINISFSTNGGNTAPTYYVATKSDPAALRIYPKNKFTVSAVAGVKIKSIVFATPANANTLQSSSTEGYSNGLWMGNESEVTFVESRSSGQSRILNIAVTYAPIAATPTFDPASGSTVDENDAISIYCATDGAKIYYTTDGTQPTMKSTLYENSISITKTTTIKAIAVIEGYVDSEVATATYYYESKNPENPSAEYNFTNPIGLQPTMSIPTFAVSDANPAEDARVFVDEKRFFNNYTNVEFKSPAGATYENRSQLWNVGEGVQVRMYNGSQVIITGAESLTIEKIEFIGAADEANLSGISAVGNLGVYSVEGNTGVWTRGGVNALAETAGEREVVTFNVATDSSVKLKSISVTTAGIPTGVEDVTVDENAPVEYYNLQGVRVANPENGIYIRRQGSKVSKVLVK